MAAQEVPSVKLEKTKTSSNEIVPCCDCFTTLALNRLKTIPVYDGTTPFESFKQEIDCVKKTISPDAEKFLRTIIILKLTGAAFTAVQNHEFRDVEELLAFLKMRFEPPTRSYLQIITDIVQSKMDQDEEVKVYHDRLSKLVKEAEEVLQNPSSRRGKKDDVNHREHLELLALQAFLKGIPQEWPTSLSYLMQSTFNGALIEVINYEKELGIITELRRDNGEQCQENEVSIGRDNTESKENNSKSNQNYSEDSNNSFTPVKGNKIFINSKKLKSGSGLFSFSSLIKENLIKQEVLNSNVSIDHSQSVPVKIPFDDTIITLGTVILYAFGKKILFQVLPEGRCSLEGDAGVLGEEFLANSIAVAWYT